MKKYKPSKNKVQSSLTVPNEDYLYFNTTEDDREAQRSIGIEYKVQNREYSMYNQDSFN